MLAGPAGSDISLAAQDMDLEMDYYDYNVVNAGAAPGSYLGETKKRFCPENETPNFRIYIDSNIVENYSKFCILFSRDDKKNMRKKNCILFRRSITVKSN